MYTGMAPKGRPALVPRLVRVIVSSMTSNLPFTIVGMGAILTVAADAPLLGLATAAIMLAWIYVSHRSTHDGWNPIMHELHRWHHDPDPAISGSPLAESCEMLSTLVGGGALFLALPSWVPLHRGIVLFSTVMYATVHLLNYHTGLSPEHQEHHRNPRSNYGPGFVDYLMGTSETMEDLTHMVPNAVGTALVVLAATGLY
jgi:hypothetical protein